MEKKKLYKTVLSSIFSVGKDLTSQEYMATILDSIIKNQNHEFPFLNNIKIQKKSKEISIKDNINKADTKKLDMALTKLIKMIIDPFSKNANKSFCKMVDAQLDKETRSELKKMKISLC